MAVGEGIRHRNVTNPLFNEFIALSNHLRMGNRAFIQCRKEISSGNTPKCSTYGYSAVLRQAHLVYRAHVPG